MRGLGSILYLRCNEVGCDGMTGILTAKRHRSDVKGSQSVFDGNTKLVAGIVWE